VLLILSYPASCSFFSVDILSGHHYPFVGAGCTPVLARLAPVSSNAFSPSWFSSSLTQLLRTFQKSAKPLFYRDDFLGEFSGNILESVAKYFPLSASAKIEASPPVLATWRVFERITWEGAKGYRYYVSKGTSIQVLEIISS